MCTQLLSDNNETTILFHKQAHWYVTAACSTASSSRLWNHLHQRKRSAQMFWLLFHMKSVYSLWQYCCCCCCCCGQFQLQLHFMFFVLLVVKKGALTNWINHAADRFGSLSYWSLFFTIMLFWSIFTFWWQVTSLPVSQSGSGIVRGFFSLRETLLWNTNSVHILIISWSITDNHSCLRNQWSNLDKNLNLHTFHSLFYC